MTVNETATESVRQWRLIFRSLGQYVLVILGLCFSQLASAAEPGGQSLINSPIGYLCLAIFVVAYAFVMLEEKLHLRKSKPVLLAAGLIWFLVAGASVLNGDTESANAALKHNLLEYSELLLFLLVAMTYINAMGYILR